MSQAHEQSVPVDPTTGAGPRGLVALIEAMRPAHWVKNGFVFAAILFSGRFDEATAWMLSLGAAISFCLLSSGVYLINDVCDRRRDLAHPSKRFRAVASGRLPAGMAMVIGSALLVGGMAVAAGVVSATPEGFWRGPSAHAPLAGWGVVVWAAAIAVPISPWLVICTFSLCLFIALTKRRAEIVDLPGKESASARRVNAVYSRVGLDVMLTVAAAMALLTYTLYSLAPGTVQRLGSAHMVWTVPVVVYGLFRFNHLSRSNDGDPVKVLIKDRAMWAVLAIYVLLVVLVVRYGGSEHIRSLLGPLS